MAAQPELPRVAWIWQAGDTDPASQAVHRTQLPRGARNAPYRQLVGHLLAEEIGSARALREGALKFWKSPIRFRLRCLLARLCRPERWLGQSGRNCRRKQAR